MRQWLYFDEIPGRVVDADPVPSPTYAQPTPADAASQSRATQRRHEVARVVLAILLLLVGVGVWLLLALPVGVLGALLGVMITSALIASALHALHASIFSGR
jgi:hypothetical protein